MAGNVKLRPSCTRELREAVLAHSTMRTLALAMALGLGVADASAAIPANPAASSTEVAEAKRVLAANGYTDIAVLSSDDRMITASVTKDGKKSVLDVDPMTGIILPHMDMAPMRSRLAPSAGLRGTPR